MSITTLEIDTAITILQTIISKLEADNPNLANNKIIADIEKAVAAIKAVGL